MRARARASYLGISVEREGTEVIEDSPLLSPSDTDLGRQNFPQGEKKRRRKKEKERFAEAGTRERYGIDDRAASKRSSRKASLCSTHGHDRSREAFSRRCERET